ncbi:MAG: hypothetical protein K2L49_00665, partial [Muribaculaceae bacterium]|nr:hypothetical protein [Muribaculaceae bacterium]
MRTLALSSTIPIADGHQIQYAQDASERTITPVGYIDGASGYHYAHCTNTPIRHIDPSGMDIITLDENFGSNDSSFVETITKWYQLNKYIP